MLEFPGALQPNPHVQMMAAQSWKNRRFTLP
jgi:hypothetical protein